VEAGTEQTCLIARQLKLCMGQGPVARITRRSRPAPGKERSPCSIAFSTNGWKEKGGTRTFNKPGPIVCSTSNRPPNRSDSMSK